MDKNVVLIVEDDEPQRIILGKIVKSQGCDVILAANANAAIAEIQTQKVNLAFVDFQLPEKTGLDFLTEAKKLRPEMPVIIITAFGNQTVLEQAVQKGAFYYIDKPYKLDLIKCVLKTLKVGELSSWLEKDYRLFKSWEYKSQDITTVRLCIECQGEALFPRVWLPENSFCVAVQKGCSICASGQACGFCANRGKLVNLTAKQIYEQVNAVYNSVQERIGDEPIKVYLTDSGEFTHNHAPTIQAVNMLFQQFGNKLDEVGLSTLGTVSGIKRLEEDINQLGGKVILQVTGTYLGTKRQTYLPGADPLPLVVKAGCSYAKKMLSRYADSRLIINHVLISGPQDKANDQKQDAVELASIIKKSGDAQTCRVKISSLLPSFGFEPSSNFIKFQEYLKTEGIESFIFSIPPREKPKEWTT